MKTYELLINGRNVKTEQSFEVLNPATEQVVAYCSQATKHELDAAVCAAQAAFVTWGKTSDSTRRQALLDIADLLEKNFSELAKLITLEQGKPLQGYQYKGAQFEVQGAIAWCRATAEMSLPVKVIVDNDASKVELHHKPLGVVGSITPWNWPLLIAVWHIMPALRTGNTVVIKPSSYTPLSTIRLVELANQVLPKGVMNVVTDVAGLGREMVSHPGINKIVFTGSTGTGKAIMKGASDTLKRLTLELGGNDAAIVLADAKVAQIAPKLFSAAFINSGQTCAAIKRLYVHDAIYDEMCDALVVIARDVTLGDGLDAEVDFGPVQNKEQLKVVIEFAESAKRDGGRFLIGGNFDPERKGYFYPITLVADIADGCKLVDEEQFGPILPIIRFSDEEEVLARANNNPNGLGGSVWSSDVAKATQLARRLECGASWVNSHGNVHPLVPFGGVKQSGFGVEFGVEGLEEYTSLQAVNISKI